MCQNVVYSVYRGDKYMHQNNNKVHRVHIYMPEKILERVNSYQEKNSLSTRTTAILELLRKGLETGDKA